MVVGDTLTVPVDPLSGRPVVRRTDVDEEQPAKPAKPEPHVPAKAPGWNISPQLPNEDNEPGKVRYRPQQGPVRVNQVDFNQVRQGALSDCYFLAPLSAIDAKHPTLLDDSIGVSPDGSSADYQFFVKGPDGAPKAVRIEVNLSLPMKGGEAVYGTSDDPRNITIGLYEKAFARFKGGTYDAIGQKGSVMDALYSLTGVKPRSIYVKDVDAETLWKGLMADNAKPMVANSTHGLSYADEKDGLVSGHTYSVLTCFERDGKRFVRLYNPIVEKVWKHDADPQPNATGTFSMPFEEFRRVFGLIGVLDL